jgi:hypothetical protein
MPCVVRASGTSRTVVDVWKSHHRFARKHIRAATTPPDERRNEGHCYERSENNVLNPHRSAQPVAFYCASRAKARATLARTARHAHPAAETLASDSIPHRARGRALRAEGVQIPAPSRLEADVVIDPRLEGRTLDRLILKRFAPYDQRRLAERSAAFLRNWMGSPSMATCRGRTEPSPHRTPKISLNTSCSRIVSS